MTHSAVKREDTDPDLSTEIEDIKENQPDEKWFRNRCRIKWWVMG